MGDDIDSMLNEDEKHIEAEELKEERERAAGKKKASSRGAISSLRGIDEDMELPQDEPGELEHINHHAVERGGAIEETIAPRFSSLSEKTQPNKKKIPAQKRLKEKGPAMKKAAGNSTRKQKERYSKE